MQLSRKVIAGAFALAGVTGLVFGVLPAADGQVKLPDKAAGWEFVGNTQCKVCHNAEKEGAQFSKWQASGHAKALETLKSDEAKKIAEDKGLTVPAHESPDCLKCHVTGYDAAAAKAPAKVKMEEGVGCESCHGPASEHTKVAQKLKFKPEMIAEVDIMATHIHPDEALCTSCHNSDSPTWKEDRYTTKDGKKAGFDYEAAWEKIAHDHPEGVMEEKYDGKYPVD
jgi:hypothetical protein